MLHKLLRVHKLKPFSRTALPKQSPVAQPQESGCTSILKIVHAGGHVESYYMAIPAATILKKYPSFLLARPAVFISPWDSVVRADEILTPGEKLLLVPHRTVRKLQSKIRIPLKEFPVNSDHSFVSQSSVDVSAAETISECKQGAAVSGEINDSSICSIIRRKTSVACKKHVTFSGIDVKHKYKSGDQIEHSSETSTSFQARRGKTLTKRRVRSAMTWQPSLTAITETQGSDHVLKP